MRLTYAFPLFLRSAFILLTYPFIYQCTRPQIHRVRTTLPSSARFLVFLYCIASDVQKVLIVYTFI